MIPWTTTDSSDLLGSLPYGRNFRIGMSNMRLMSLKGIGFSNSEFRDRRTSLCILSVAMRPEAQKREGQWQEIHNHFSASRRHYVLGLTRSSRNLNHNSETPSQAYPEPYTLCRKYNLWVPDSNNTTKYPESLFMSLRLVCYRLPILTLNGSFQKALQGPYFDYQGAMLNPWWRLVGIRCFSSPKRTPS